MLPLEPGLVDLHSHTTFSDGLMSPEEVVAEAKELGLAAIGITDHDAVGGIERAVASGRKLGIEVVPGVEMSCTANGIDVHMLGYYLENDSDDVDGFLSLIRTKRHERARKIVGKLAELGVQVSLARIEELADGAVGRPHVAQAIVEAGGARNIEEAFQRFIGYDGPAYFPKMQLTPEETVDFIHRNRGIAVVAHPGTYHNDAALYSAIAAGADGVEVWHPDHNPRNVDHYSEVAQKNGLLMTGGSDCHGGRKQGRVFLGQVAIPYKYLQALKNLRDKRERKSG